jgi:hypothetical protein
MATATMIECPTCNQKVSTSAQSCPSCGAVLRKPKRGLFGKLIIFAFWGFNILMAVWIFGGAQNAAQQAEGLTGAEAAGAAIGTGIGIAMLVAIWIFGAIILGIMAMLTRPK